MSTPQRILVIGGGAAGFFAAITSAENSNAQVFLYESSISLRSHSASIIESKDFWRWTMQRNACLF
ncbi:FAD-binding protein [bacterium]|nr:FAD-binding protein [bacterium]